MALPAIHCAFLNHTIISRAPYAHRFVDDGPSISRKRSAAGALPRRMLHQRRYRAPLNSREMAKCFRGGDGGVSTEWSSRPSSDGRIVDTCCKPQLAAHLHGIASCSDRSAVISIRVCRACSASLRAKNKLNCMSIWAWRASVLPFQMPVPVPGPGKGPEKRGSDGDGSGSAGNSNKGGVLSSRLQSAPAPCRRREPRPGAE